MSLSVGDVLKVVTILSWLDGNVMQNVFNAVIGGTGGPYTDADIVADALAWSNSLFTQMLSSMSDECDGSEVRVYVFDPLGLDWDEVGSVPWSVNPTGASEQLPRGVAMLINCKTTNPDVNGKKYIGGGIEDGVIGGLWVGTVVAALADLADIWVTPFTGGVSGADWIPGVWSPTKELIFDMSGAYIIGTIPAYQRRRKRGVGI